MSKSRISAAFFYRRLVSACISLLVYMTKNLLSIEFPIIIIPITNNIIPYRYNKSMYLRYKIVFILVQYTQIRIVLFCYLLNEKILNDFPHNGYKDCRKEISHLDFLSKYQIKANGKNKNGADKGHLRNERIR